MVWGHGSQNSFSFLKAYQAQPKIATGKFGLFFLIFSFSILVEMEDFEKKVPETKFKFELLNFYIKHSIYKTSKVQI